MLVANPAPSKQSSLFNTIVIASLCAMLAIAASAQNYTDLADFNMTNGAHPYYVTPILGADGNLYGTTSSGGAHNFGGVFKVTFSGTLTDVHDFAGAPNDGGSPIAGLVLATDGNFYGTTSEGGSNGGGSVFRMTPDGTVTLLHSFAGSDGVDPLAALVQASDGNLYGTTAEGGMSNAGTAFKVTVGGDFHLLHSFNGTDGAFPNGLVQGTDGNFYGTTTTGGANSGGTVFQMTPSGAVRTLHNFAANDGNGDLPYAALVQGTDGNFYGTTAGDGTLNFGTVFKITSSGSFTLLHSFDVDPGSGPYAPLVQATDGNFYGTTATTPTIFKITPQGALTTLYSFFPTAGPYGGLVQLNGVFYGTTKGGGADNDGSVYSITTGQFFVPVTPCRLVDTRGPDGPFGGPALQGNTQRSFNLPQNPNCHIPATAAAYSLNVTVVPHGRLNYLTIWPTGQDQPLVSTLNSPDGRTKANAAIVPAGAGGPVSVYVTDTTDLVLDIDGYFALEGSELLQFYPLTPCRVVDTRQGSQQPSGLGPPFLQTMETRDLPILSSPCLQGLPQQPKAYSFNATVVPNPLGQPLGYLTLWPSDQQQPVVSTLNNPTATVVANAAIVPAAANGNIKTFVFNSTDLIIDINGYFAPASQNGFAFYRLVPCRAFDTRIQRMGPFQGVLSPPVDLANGNCMQPSNAGGYVLNATVVPTNGPMGYLTLWPDGENQPIVSTLNAHDGQVTSNAAIVPNVNGMIDAYAAGLTQLILDISGYFAP
jgi:uncharacterized repeat protein (TIGR03803 family)